MLSQTTMIDLTVYLNQFLLPIALFALILSSFYLESSLAINNSNFSNNYSSELDKFYEAIYQDSNLLSQLDFIMEGENFLEKIVNLGNSLGYKFTTLDLSQSITGNTANSDSNYVCLPVGCWHVSSV